jgi:CRP/FNR family cyclic AMP-dependent transcriptional regulator
MICLGLSKNRHGFYPLRVRLAGRLLSLIGDYGVTTDEGTYLDVQLSQNDFARLCLGSRQRINKIFRQWTEQGILEMQADRYMIFDVAALQREISLEEL